MLGYKVSNLIKLTIVPALEELYRDEIWNIKVNYWIIYSDKLFELYNLCKINRIIILLELIQNNILDIPLLKENSIIPLLSDILIRNLKIAIISLKKLINHSISQIKQKLITFFLF